MKRTSWLIAVSLVILAGLGFYALIPPTSEESPELASPETPEPVVVGTTVANRPIEVLTAGFASASSCTRCHEEQHQSWHASFHSKMTQKISPETAPTAIDDGEVTVEGVTYQFKRDGDRYLVAFGKSASPDTMMVPREMVLMTGSHHMHVFWYETPPSLGRTLAQLPIVFLIDQQRWIPRNAAFVRPSSKYEDEAGRWNQVCSRCHSTHPRGRLDEESGVWDTHVADFGIACEACHGPGEKHIRIHDKLADFGEEDDVVVSPTDLPHELQSDVCGQCHSVQIPDFEAYDRGKFLLTGMPFRPGDNLEDSKLRKVVRTTPAAQLAPDFDHGMPKEDRDHFWADGTVRVAGREYNGLIESPCFQNGTMSCLSCHEMHPDASVDLNEWRDDQLKPGMRGNLACTQCHTEPQYTTEVTKHTHHQVDSHGSQCMNCHMPHTTYGLLKSVRSHRIESPEVITTLTTGRPTGCAMCHLDRTISWTAEHLADWYGQQSYAFQDPAVTEVSATLVSLLRGNAAIRAVQTAGFGWKPAQEASGTDWMAPYLMVAMNDDYDVIRIIAKRTLRSLPGFEELEYDEFETPEAREKWLTEASKQFNRDHQLEPNSALLIDENGNIDFDKAREMLKAQDQTPVVLRE